MKILFITRSPFGLMGTAGSYMLPSEISKIHQVRVLSPKINNKSHGKIVFHNDNIDTFNFSQNSSLIQQANEAAAYIDILKPDIVHVFSQPGCFLFPIIYKQFKKNDIKWYLDIRSHIFSLNKKKHLQHKIINSIYYKAFDYITATSYSNYKSYVFYPHHKIKLSPIGVDTSLFKPPQQNDKNHHHFIFVGSIAKVRKLLPLIKGFYDFSKIMNEKYILDLYGHGNNVENIQAFINEKKAHQMIRIKGILNQDELAHSMTKYRAGFVYLPQDKFNDAPALKRLEYAAAGIDILETNTLWHRKNIENIRSFKFENTNCDIKNTLLDYIKFCNESNTITEWAKHNRNAVKQFDWNYIATNIVNKIYSHLINGS